MAIERISGMRYMYELGLRTDFRHRSIILFMPRTIFLQSNIVDYSPSSSSSKVTSTEKSNQ